MKQILFGIVLGIFIAVAAGIFYLKTNPPLNINDYSNNEDETISLLKIENNGFRDVKIEEILVNGKPTEQVEIAVSKKDPLNAEALIASELLTLHKPNNMVIYPKSWIDQNTNGNLPKQYGIKISAADVKKVMVRYTYLKIPYTRTIEVR